MKDKEKQIEEISNIIKAVKYEPFNYGKPTYTVGTQMQDFVFDLIAEELIKQGYQKIDKDKEVVLSREEFWKLSNKFSKKELDEIVEFHKNKVRKETAEKIFKELKTRLKDCPEVIEEGYNVQNSVDYFEDIIGYDKFCADEIIKELAKQFGVE